MASGALLAGAVIGTPHCFGTFASSASYYAFQFTNGTSSSQDSVNLVLSGDQSASNFGLSGAYENSLGTSSSANYASGSTTIAFTGSSVSGSGTATATVGFGWKGLLAPDITGAYWGNGSTDTSISPLPLTASPPSNLSDPWTVITYDVSSNGSPGTRYWFEEQFTNGSNPQLDLTYSNYGRGALSDVGYFISDSLIPLDQLNYPDEPPPGATNSPFTALPTLDGQSISGTGSLNFTLPLPIPSPLALAGVGAIGLLAVHQLRKRRRGDAI